MERKQRRITEYADDNKGAGSSRVQKVVEEEEVLNCEHLEEPGEFNIQALNDSARNSINEKIKKEIVPEGTIMQILGSEQHTSKKKKYKLSFFTI